MEVSLGMSGFVENICDNLFILVFNEDVEKLWFFKIEFLFGTVEYADSISSLGYDISNESPGYDTKLYLMVGLQLRAFGECKVSFHCHYYQVHLTVCKYNY